MEEQGEACTGRSAGLREPEKGGGGGGGGSAAVTAAVEASSRLSVMEEAGYSLGMADISYLPSSVDATHGRLKTCSEEWVSDVSMEGCSSR
ncbi:hypothetical protein GDO81_029617 [Engystomops pustulosus]|uniref:Uncharacterized protein n=1 Tax=Engystomops pustulosus TaxID=76066 RepID=A0AAV6YVL6_ENGPU|nr:hypothetical protein GDO81_029617 [Engystomops pustulosus]